MNDKLDKQFRDLEPGLRPRDEFRHHLRTELLSQYPRRRGLRHFIPFLIVAVIMVTLLIVGHETKLGNTDFSLKSEGDNDAGKPIYKGENEALEYLATSGIDKESLEQAYQQEAAGQEHLIAVIGWTVKGNTYFETTYEYFSKDRIHTVSRVVENPDFQPDREHLAFLTQHEKTFLTKVTGGEADTLAPKKQFIAGILVEFDRWRLNIPEWGEVIYWKGHFSTTPPNH